MYTTVLNGKDYEVLEILISLHASSSQPVILDTTYGGGVMWKKCSFQPHERIDIREELEGLTRVLDFSELHTVFQKEFDVIVFDPPHLPGDAANELSSSPMISYYGLKTMSKDSDNVNHLFRNFLVSAKQVLNKEGIILAKIADLTHNHRYQWQHVDFINACFELEMQPCDLMIKVDPAGGNLKSSKWQNQYHLRKSHCYWIVVRHGGSCERKRREVISGLSFTKNDMISMFDVDF